MTKGGYYVINYIAFYTTLLPIAIGLWRWKSLSTPVKTIVTLSIVSFIADLSTKILRSQGINSNVFLQLYTIASTGILFYFYFSVLGRPALKKPLLFIFIALSSVTIYGWFFSTNLNLSGVFLSTHTFFILALGLIYFATFFAVRSSQSIVRNHLFWINSGLVFYSAGILTLFISMEYLINVLKVDMFLYWSVNNISSIVLNLICFIGIWLSLVKSKSIVKITEVNSVE